MTASASATARKTLTVGRLGTSAKTLHRKAMEKAAAAPAPVGEGLEELFPQRSDVSALPLGLGPDTAVTDIAPQQAVESIESSATPALNADAPASAPTLHDASGPEAAGPAGPDALPSWSSEDERSFQALLLRRKAAGFQRRGRDVSAQTVAVGKISPNAGTVVAAIVALVAERGPLSRGALIDLMATPAFSHPKGKGNDRDWAVGYVGGAVRDGFLAVVPEGQPLGELSPDAPAVMA